MVQVFRESLRVCAGLVAFVVEGFTKQFRWSATPALLMADLHRAGICLRTPPIFYRVGIPGSGGPDWLRNDRELIVCATRGGELLWSDNTALGEPCRYAPGGAMSHRLPSGLRKGERWKKHCTQGGDDGKGEKVRTVLREYLPPDTANPGNVIKCAVGGGKLGSNLAHGSEAPFPEALAELFIRSFAQPGSLVLDPFSGSGTTVAVAVKCGRRGLGIDIRESQIKLGTRRLEGVTPEFAAMA